jgi:hypothetical protein
MLDSLFHCPYIESREVPEKTQQKPCEKKTQEIRENSGGKYLPLISVSGSRVPRFPSPIKLPPRYNRNIVENGI